jgi:putative ABC transport system permease protein
MNLAIRDIRHHLGRFVLTCLGLGMLLGVVIAMIGIYRGLVAEAVVLVRAPAADLWVVEGGTKGPFAEASRIPKDSRNTIARIEGVAEAGAVTYQSVQIAVGSASRRVLVVGFEPGRPGGPAQLDQGRTVLRSHFELVADRRTGLSVGQSLRIGKDTFTVVGLTTGQVDSGGNPLVYMSLQDAERLQFQLEGAAARNQAQRGQESNRHQVNAVVARLHGDADADRVAASIERWKHLSALTQERQEDLLLGAVVEKARKQIGMFTVTLLAVSTVIIALIIHTMTMDKTREIATLKLIGAPDRAILSLIVQQSLALGGLGFVLGATLITLTADHFPRRVILHVQDVAALGVVVILVCVLASLLGVRQAMKIDAAQALGG